jgi:P-type conjugative transfer protein TrbJ
LATQALEYARQVQQYALQAEQFKTQLLQYQNMIQSTTALPQAIWSNVMGDISAVRNLANADSLLTGASGSAMSRLASASGYANQAAFLPENIGRQFATWQQTLSNSANSLGRTLATQRQQQIGYANQQQQIAAQSQAAVGQLSAIMATNESLGLIITKMNQLQTSLTSAAQQQATRDLVAEDRQAAADQAKIDFLTPPAPLPVTGLGC